MNPVCGPESSALPLSVAIVTLNEEASLPRLLASIRSLASEIIIIDSGSKDRTAEIAREHQAIFETAPWSGFTAQKNRAMERCSHPWVLSLDADEEISPELATSIREFLKDGGPAGVVGAWLNRRTWYLGAWIWHAWYPEWRLRLVRRGRGKWGGIEPHSSIECEGSTVRLQGDLLHYSFRDLQDHLQRTIRYARTAAESYAARGREFRWYYLLLSPWVAFFKHLVLKQGWRDGWRGWLISAIRMLDCFAKYAFLLERKLSPRGT